MALIDKSGKRILWSGVFLFTSIFVAISCGHHKQQQQEEGEIVEDKIKAPMSKAEAVVYEDTMDKVKYLERQLTDIPSASYEQVEKFLGDVEKLVYLNNTAGMDPSAKKSCEELLSICIDRIVGIPFC